MKIKKRYISATRLKTKRALRSVVGRHCRQLVLLHSVKLKLVSCARSKPLPAVAVRPDERLDRYSIAVTAPRRRAVPPSRRPAKSHQGLLYSTSEG